MAEETAFGLSFGDPRKYMGKSPIAEIGQALKSAGLAYGIEKSGARQFLDDMGVEMTNKGGFSLKQAPVGSAPPITSAKPMPVVPSQLGAAPMAPTGAGVQVTPFGPESPSNVQTTTFQPPDPKSGMQILDNTFKPQSSVVNPQAERDFNPFTPDTSNQMAVSGMDYQKVPGYGKLAKMAQMFGGMG